ncbi:MAG: alpha/beta hydrolase [Massilia sp.]
MTAKLNDVLVDPVSGLAHRVRPAGAAQPKAHCLLLLHGVGANESGFVELARQMDPRLVVILVRGPVVFGPAQFGWFPVRFEQAGPVIDAEQAERSRSKLVSFIHQLPKAYDIDPERIWIAGFSQGGIMSASVGLTAPASIAGFAILSGRILPEVLPAVQHSPQLRSVHAFVAHGVQDQKLGVHFAHHAKAVLSELELPLDYREYAAGHVLDDAMVGDFKQWLGQRIDQKTAATGKVR